MAADFKIRFDLPTKTSVMENDLVNPSGIHGRWHERDLLQEHLNFWLKRVYNNHLQTFDSSFFREAVSLNIVELKELLQNMFLKLGITPTHNGRSHVDLDADINFLGLAFQRQKLHVFVPSRTQTFITRDSFDAGTGIMLEGAVEAFMERYEISKYFTPVVTPMPASA